MEDEPLISYGYRMHFERAGFEVVNIARTAPDAEMMLAEKNPDVILMDIHLKGNVNGLELAKLIRKKNPIPIIFITASTRPEILKEIAEIKNCQLLPKPVNTDYLEELVKRMKKAP